MHSRTPRALTILLVSLLAGCGGQKGPDLNAEVNRLKGELDAAKQKLADTEKALAAKNDEAAKAAADAFAAEATRKQAVQNDEAVVKKDAQIRALQAELAGLKKQDALAFAEASAVQQKGLTTIALDRYRQFAKDYPNSPLVPHAERAIAELTKTADTEAKWRQSLIDPKKPQRDVLQRFADGAVTLDEIVPLLKDRDSAQVVTLLGKPNQTYRGGTEYGYVNKVIDTATGNKETLVIVFDGGRVASFRLGYRGREIKP